MDRRERLQKERQKKKERKKNKQLKKLEEAQAKATKIEEEVVPQDDDVEIEYVVVNPFEGVENDEEAEELKQIFASFSLPTEQDMMEEDDKTAPTEQLEVKEEKLSKKKRKLQKRLPVALLKSMVDRPDLVEVHDTSAANPFMLVHLKSLRNTVPVPRHWSQKRKYLHGKRGIEKPPFELPDFIKATGIMELRGAALDKEATKKLSQKARDRLNPSMGRCDIDYQILHDAFFKHQTKPRMTIYADVYFEGKEYEVEMQEKRPGVLSQKLKEALGMTEFAPPPWLHAQQRVGLPPSYPHLKLPGINSPLPLGCEYGFHPGGWGRSPVDSDGHPLYPEALRDPQEVQAERPVISHWGAVIPGEESSSEESQNEEMSEEPDVAEPTATDKPAAPVEITETPTFEAPTANLESALRKKKKEPTKGGELYKVLEEQEVGVGSGELYGSSHKYVIEKTKPATGSGPERVDLMKSQKTGAVELSLDPTELGNLSEAALKQRFDKVMSDKQNPESGAPADSKKRKNEDSSSKPRKKKKTGLEKEFKF